MMARMFGMRSAPATPWASREATRTPGLGATPHIAELAVKSASPSENVRRRPIRSPSRAPETRKTAEVSP
jgi:hypothetical protein